MKVKKLLCGMLSVALLLSLCACGVKAPQTSEPKETPAQTQPQNVPAETEAAPAEVTVTDMIGREVSVVPGSYSRVVCIGAGALRMYSAPVLCH